MYPSKADEYYPPPPQTAAQSAVMTGIPVMSNTSQYHYASAPPAAFQMDQSQAAVGPWSTGLCGCCDDVGNCCLTCFCPCITFGQIAEIVDRGSTSCGTSAMLYTLILCLLGCPFCYSCFYRSKMRAQYRLQEGPCGDCCVHWCCEPCALCQEYRELKRRGFDLSIGWHGNMERQGRVAMAPPAIQGGMER